MSQTTSTVFTDLAKAYVEFLTAVPWHHPLVVSGLKEGLNKFLSNAYLYYFYGKNKYHLTQFATPAAIQQMQAGNYRGLIFEHMVPKRKFIQEPCEKLARKGQLETEFVADLLDRYWILATVTQAENSQLTRSAMPANWDQVNCFARYDAAGLVLELNPLMHVGVPVHHLNRSLRSQNDSLN